MIVKCCVKIDAVVLKLLGVEALQPMVDMITFPRVRIPDVPGRSWAPLHVVP